jgi:hypothetical protein
MKLAAGWNVYFRRLCSYTRPTMARLSAMRAETIQRYVDAEGRFFFNEPYLRYFANLVNNTPVEAQPVVRSAHITAGQQRKAIGANVRRELTAAAENGVEIQPKEGLRLLLNPGMTLSAAAQAMIAATPELVTEDEKGRKWLNPLALPVSVRLYANHKDSGLPVGSATWQVADGADQVALNQAAIAKFNRNGTSVYWTL